jgi:hypothetical protein
MRSDETLAAVPDSLDFVHSVLVFQIEVPRGYQFLAALLSKMNPGGMGALHFPYLCRHVSRLHKFATAVTKNLDLLNGFANLVHGLPFSTPRMQHNHYS